MDSLLAKTAPADADGIAHAARILRGGGLVAFPTETVYGLGADATNGKAVAGIFAAKGRPRFNPLIVHVRDASEAERHALFSDPARRLAARFWPGALTLVLPRATETLWEKVDFILDGGPAMLGLESTVIGFDGDQAVLLRPGAITREEIEAIVG